MVEAALLKGLYPIDSAGIMQDTGTVGRMSVIRLQQPPDPRVFRPHPSVLAADFSQLYRPPRARGAAACVRRSHLPTVCGSFDTPWNPPPAVSTCCLCLSELAP